MKKNKFYVTNGVTTDGFGARLGRSLFTMAYTHYFREKYGVSVEYIHTPFSYEGFGIDYSVGEKVRRESDCDFPYNMASREGYLIRASLWDDKLKYSHIKVTDINFEEFEIQNIYKCTDEELLADASNSKNNKLYILEYVNNGFYFSNHVEKYFDEFGERFSFERTHSNNIDIHIRRSIDAIRIGGYMYVDDTYYLNLLEALKPYNDRYNIIIHTQRKYFEFNKYPNYNVLYDDMEEDYDAFINMVSAKVLIVGKSWLSLSAAIMNKNIIVYPPECKLVSECGLVNNKWHSDKQFIKFLNTLL